MTSPVQELRAAATRLRSLATAATPGPWTAQELPPTNNHPHPAHWVNADYTDHDDTRTLETIADCPWRQADANYIAAMGPNVGAATVELLDAAAGMAADYPDLARDHNRPACDDYACNLMGAALTLARAINTGGQP